MPNFKSKFIGLRYQYRSFHTRLLSDKSQFSNDYFQTVELWGGFNLGRKWQLLGFIPYAVNKQVSDEGKHRTNGLGDVAMLLNYSLLDKPSLSKSQKTIYQQLSVGAGIKLPTGTSNVDPTAPDLVALANSQLGTGSVDILLNAAYTIHIDDLGFSSNLNYKLNTTNKESYRFGNRIASNTFLFYTVKNGNVKLMPNAGILYEHSATNYFNGVKVEQTGGYTALGTAGIEISIHTISIGMNVQAPFAENFAYGQTKSNPRAMIHFTVSF